MKRPKTKPREKESEANSRPFTRSEFDAILGRAIKMPALSPLQNRRKHRAHKPPTIVPERVLVEITL